MTDTITARPRSLGARVGALDPQALARAEAALQALSGQFAGWMAEELGRLESARDGLRTASPSAEAWDELHARAHDLKGLGATYGHPMATRICASLCRLLDSPSHRSSAPRALAEAHVAAVRASVDGDPAAAGACERLEAAVTDELEQRTRR